MAKTGLEGELLGSFRVLGELGRGGMAIVYRGVQESLSRPVAIKVLPFEFSESPELIKRFHREAEAMATLSHPNIVQIIDRGDKDGVLYFVMEYLDGGALKDLLGKQKEIPFQRIVDIALQICAGLEHAHAHGIVHRDLKPANVLVDARTGNLKIADFGIASFTHGPESATLTSSHVAMGTLNYMSPEQKLDAKNVDQRTDIFALGVILYEMFTGTLPMGSFDPPSDVNRTVPRAVDAIVLKALKSAPQQRYQTVAELAQDLRRLRDANRDVGVIARAIRPVVEAFTAASTIVGHSRGRAMTLLVLVAVAAVGYAWIARGVGPSGAVGASTSESTLTAVSSSSSAGVASSTSASTSTDIPPSTSTSTSTSASASTASSVGAGSTTASSTGSGSSAAAVPVDVQALRERLDRAGTKVEIARRAADRALARRLAARAFAEGLMLEEGADNAVFENDLAGAIDLYEAATTAYRAASKEATERSVQDPEGKTPEDRGMPVDPRVQEADRERRVTELQRAERRWDAMEGVRARALGLDAPTKAAERFAKGEAARQEGIGRREFGDSARATALFEAATRSYQEAIALCEAAEEAAVEAARAKEQAAREAGERERASALAAARKEADRASLAARAARDDAERASTESYAEDAWKRAVEEEAQGHTSYGAGNFEVATVKLDHARGMFEQATALARTERERRETNKLRLDAAVEREKAIAAGAQERAADGFARAQEAEHAANDLFAGGRYADARTRFRAAVDLYLATTRAAVGSATEASTEATPPAPDAAAGALAIRSVTPVLSLVPAGKGAGQASYPKGLAADASGAIYYADTERGAVTKISAAGVVQWEVKDFSKPSDVALSPDGATLYVANAGTGALARLRASDGRREADWGREETGEGLVRWKYPYALAVGRAGEVWVYDRTALKVVKVEPDGRVGASVAAIGPINAGLAVDGKGRVYFTEADGVKRYDPADGTTKPFAAHLNPMQATGIAVDARERVYICDARQSRVVIVSPEGERLREVRNGSDGAIRMPLQVAVGAGRMYLLDFKAAKKVHVFEVK